MLDLVLTTSPVGHGALAQYQDIHGVANWLEAQKSEMHHPLASAQSMTSNLHLLDHALLPRALSAFPLARQAAQPCSSSCDSASEAPGEYQRVTAACRPYSSGDRLQNLKRRQQVLPLGNLLVVALRRCPLRCFAAMTCFKGFADLLHRTSSGPRALLYQACHP